MFTTGQPGYRAAAQEHEHRMRPRPGREAKQPFNGDSVIGPRDHADGDLIRGAEEL